MNTHTAPSAKARRGKGWTRAMLLPAILALLPLFGSINAQPIDLCSYPNGIELESGGVDLILPLTGIFLHTQRIRFC